MRLIWDGEKGVWRWKEREIIYLSLHCHHQNDFYIKVGSGERHINVSLILRDSHKTVSIDNNFRSERRAEADSNRDPSPYQPNALPLCQTGPMSFERLDPILYIYMLGLLKEGQEKTSYRRIYPTQFKVPQSAKACPTSLRSTFIIKMFYTVCSHGYLTAVVTVT